MESILSPSDNFNVPKTDEDLFQLFVIIAMDSICFLRLNKDSGLQSIKLSILQQKNLEQLEEKTSGSINKAYEISGHQNSVLQ